MYIRKQSNGNGSSVSDKLAHKDWCVANASTISLAVANITWEIVQ